MNKEEFSLRVTSAQGRMYRIASSYLHGEHDRLDAISETIFKAWRKQASLKNEQYFDTWLVRILIHECIDIQRKQRRAIPVSEMPECEAQPTENNELRLALDALPQKLRIVTVLHYMEGYRVDEVARALSVTKGAVCSRLFRARELLRGLLKEEIE